MAGAQLLVVGAQPTHESFHEALDVTHQLTDAGFDVVVADMRGTFDSDQLLRAVEPEALVVVNSLSWRRNGRDYPNYVSKRAEWAISDAHFASQTGVIALSHAMPERPEPRALRLRNWGVIALSERYATLARELEIRKTRR